MILYKKVGVKVLTMDKYLIKSSSTLEALDDSIPLASPFTLGVLGSSTSSKWTKETIQESLLTPILEQFKDPPNSLLLPSDGTTSVFLQVCAQKSNIKTLVFDADWKTLGKRARALRDARIIQDSTHLLIFLGTKSDFYEKIAIREAKKGKVVFTVDPKTHEIIQWEI